MFVRKYKFKNVKKGYTKEDNVCILSSFDTRDSPESLNKMFYFRFEFLRKPLVSKHEKIQTPVLLVNVYTKIPVQI